MADESIMTIRQYSISRCVTYEAVRRQVIRYSNELKGHIHKQGNRKYLDAEAISFLDEHRQPKTVIVSNDGESIQAEREGYIQKIDLLRDKVESLQEQIIQLQSDNMNLQAEISDLKTNQMIYLESKEAIENILRQDLEDAKQEVQSFKKSIFGFYRKK